MKEKFGKLYHEAWWAKRRDQGIFPKDIPTGHGHHSVGHEIGRRDRAGLRHRPCLRYLPGPCLNGIRHPRCTEPASRRPWPGHRGRLNHPPPGRRRASTADAQHAYRSPGRLLRPPRLPPRPFRPHPTQTPLRSRRLRRLGLAPSPTHRVIPRPREGSRTCVFTYFPKISSPSTRPCDTCGVGHSARPEPSRRVSRAEWAGCPDSSLQLRKGPRRFEDTPGRERPSVRVIPPPQPPSPHPPQQRP